MNKNEQWLLNGDCTICRRENYCSKPCTKSKRNAKRRASIAIASMMCNIMLNAHSSQDDEKDS